METEGSSAVPVKKPRLTAKAVIFNKFGKEARYVVDEVQDDAQNGCPGLAITHKGPCLYRCTLHLPEFSVVSDTFKKKKDAEQNAAEKALKKLGMHTDSSSPSPEEAWNSLLSWIKYIFSDKFLLSPHPLSGHMRAALQRDNDLHGSIPASAVAIYDPKPSSLCKIINPKVELNYFLLILYIMRAAAAASESIVISEGQLSLRRRSPYPPEIIEPSVIQQPDYSPDNTCFKVIHIPCSLEKDIRPVTLNVTSHGYYLDVIAHTLGLTNANQILVSRNIGKASSEVRMYFAAPKSYLLDLTSDLQNVKEEVQFEGSLNSRASYLYGVDIYGDAILASVGYTWRSKDLSHEDITLQSYYRMLENLWPSGVYKLSRSAMLTAELPLAFTVRTNWRGSFPRDILCSFCRQHWLSEPVFSTSSVPSTISLQSSTVHNQLLGTESAIKEQRITSGGANGTANQDSMFKCEVKLYSKSLDLILKCSPSKLHKKQSDSVQNASLNILTLLNAYFKDPDMPLEKLKDCAAALEIRLYPQHFPEKFAMSRFIYEMQPDRVQEGKLLKSDSVNVPNTTQETSMFSLSIGGPHSGACLSNGYLISISYSVSLVIEGEDIIELLESMEEFEFETGVGAVIPQIEAVVTQMSVGQSACFRTTLPSLQLLLAAAADPARIHSLLLSKASCLEYCITLLRLTEPPEDRMEQALFSPPLSKQRLEYALHHIKENGATSLVDFGCGSGSLLDSLIDYPTALEKFVGVDISQKSLSRAAKILHSKLSKSNGAMPLARIKSAVLYDGSILEFDPRLRGFDIGTCLEVIEHMEEHQASLFGNIVLSSFQPSVLIVSTPNYEYNVILQKSGQAKDDTEDKPEEHTCKFRNHDHKFEWTRAQFNRWASKLAEKHNYSVEFSGVGGSGDVEPGFASQIALFRRNFPLEKDAFADDEDSAHHYRVVWKWD